MSFILEIARRARDAGLPANLEPPLSEVPASILGVTLDPQLVAIYQVSNGLEIGDFFITAILGGKNFDLEADSASTRRDLDTLPLLHDVLLWGYVESIQVEITSIPALADEQGRQPVVILDLNDAPHIEPLASTVNRAVELIVQDCILTGGDYESREPLPIELADDIARDTRLMELIDAGAFHALGVEVAEEWLDMLRAARAQAGPDIPA